MTMVNLMFAIGFPPPSVGFFTTVFFRYLLLFLCAIIHANAHKLNNEAILGAVQRVRIVCSHAKIDDTVDLARSILNKEPALVIFSNFTQMAKQVHEKLSGSGWPSELLTGERPQKNAKDTVDKFQSGLSSEFL